MADPYAAAVPSKRVGSEGFASLRVWFAAAGLLVLGFVVGVNHAAAQVDYGNPLHAYYYTAVGGGDLYHCAAADNTFYDLGSLHAKGESLARRGGLCALTRTAGAGQLDVSVASFLWDGYPKSPSLCGFTAVSTNAGAATSQSSDWLVQASPRCGGVEYSVTSFHKIQVQGVERDLIYPTPTHHFF